MTGHSCYPNGLDLGSSTELITLKPWSTGKQLPLGFSVFDRPLGQGKGPSFKQQATSVKQLPQLNAKKK